MATSLDQGGQWETQAEIDACLVESRVTKDQVVRWRREGLLPEVRQIPDAYRGSVVLYPRGTCAQIKAAKELFEKKNRVDFVGLRLWRQGFPVDEKFWRPRLRRQAHTLDRMLPLLGRLVRRFNRVWDEQTLYDHAAIRLEPIHDIILSRVKGRVDSEQLPTVLGIIGDVGLGAFVGNDATELVRAIDLTNARSHSILGKKLNLIQLLPSGLGNVSRAMRIGKFERVADAPAEEIDRARDDARNGVAIGFCLYEANRWIYGEGAFGLRFAAWIARKAPHALVDNMTLLMFRLRQVPDAILPSDKIAEMAKQARDACIASRKLEWLWLNDPRFSEILNPKRIRLAFADQIMLRLWQRELNAIIIQGAERPLIGSNHES